MFFIRTCSFVETCILMWKMGALSMLRGFARLRAFLGPNQAKIPWFLHEAATLENFFNFFWSCHAQANTATSLAFEYGFFPAFYKKVLIKKWRNKIKWSSKNDPNLSAYILTITVAWSCDWLCICAGISFQCVILIHRQNAFHWSIHFWNPYQLYIIMRP